MLVDLVRLLAEAFITVGEERSANTSACEECQNTSFRAAEQGIASIRSWRRSPRVMVDDIHRESASGSSPSSPSIWMSIEEFFPKSKCRCGDKGRDSSPYLCSSGHRSRES